MKAWENQPHSLSGATLAVAETNERTDDLVEIAVLDRAIVKTHPDIRQAFTYTISTSRVMSWTVGMISQASVSCVKIDLFELRNRICPARAQQSFVSCSGATDDERSWANFQRLLRSEHAMTARYTTSLSLGHSHALEAV